MLGRLFSAWVVVFELALLLATLVVAQLAQHRRHHRCRPAKGSITLEAAIDSQAAHNYHKSKSGRNYHNLGCQQPGRRLQEPSMGFAMARNTLVKLDEVPGKYHVKKLALGTILKSGQ